MHVQSDLPAAPGSIGNSIGCDGVVRETVEQILESRNMLGRVPCGCHCGASRDSMLLNTVYPALSGLPIGKFAYISGGCSQHTGRSTSSDLLTAEPSCFSACATGQDGGAKIVGDS